MKPFTLPEFNLPHPARLDPQLEYAREHSVARRITTSTSTAAIEGSP